MTVSNQDITAGPYTGNGVADTFSYGFRVEDKTEMKVYETGTGGRILLTVDTDYTVNNVGDESGTVTRTAGPLPSGYKWFIRSDYADTQETEFESQGAFFPDIHEKAMDKLTRLVQQLRDLQSRALAVDEGYEGDYDLTIPDPVEGELLRFTDTGIEGVTLGDMLAEAATIVASLSMNGYRITDLADAINGTDAVNKQYVDNTKISKADGNNTMAQDLDMGGNKVSNLARAESGSDAVNLTQVIEYLTGAGVDGVIPTVQPRQVGDGTTTVYSTPTIGVADASPNSFFVTLDGVTQRPITDFSINTGGYLEFVEAPTLNTAIDITYFNPVSLGDLSAVAVTATGTTTPRTLGDRFADTTNVEDFSSLVVGNDWTAAISAAIAASPRSGKLVCSAGDIEISSDIHVVEKGRPDNGVYEIDFTGTTVSGTGNFIFDSCKNLSVKGLQAPTLDVILRGVWYSNFRQCKATRLINADQVGTTFTSCYWNDFHTCVFQTIVRGATGFPVNAYTFYGVNLRGNTGQGFVTTADYALIFEGTTNDANAQNWCFYGGDISYPVAGVYDASGSAAGSDIELTFNGIYFDSEVPVPIARDAFRLSIVDCHAANIDGFNADTTASSRGQVDIFRSDRWLKLTPDNNHNLVPFGDFSTVVGDPFSDILSSSGGAVATASIGGPYGQVINITNATTGSTFVRSRPSQVKGIATATVLLKSAVGSGTQSVKIGFGFGQTRRFHEFAVTEEWSIYTMTDAIEGAAGTTPSLTISNAAAGTYSIDIGMLSTSIGAGGGTRGAVALPQGAQMGYQINPPSIPALGLHTADISMTGALVGDSVLVTSVNSTYSDLILDGSVVVDGTVRIKIFNPTSGAIDPANTSLNIVCRSHVLR